MIVLDASAAFETLVGRKMRQRLRERLRAEELHAPHLIEVEFLETLRRAVRSRVMSANRAADARDDFVDLRFVLYPHGAFGGRAWELRKSVSAYDAMYVALAEALAAPLVTCDRRLARAPGVHATIELFAS